MTETDHLTHPRSASTAGRFWRFWAASAVSRTGDAVTAVALPLVAVGSLGATSLQVSFITAASYAAWVLIGLPAGIIVERLPLRGTQVALDLARAVAIASVPVAAWAGVLHLAQLVVVALVIGLASVVFDVGNSTYLPSLVSKEELTSRNSLTSATTAATELGGPSLGGVLVQLLGAASALVVDAVSYLVSGVLMATLPRHDRLDGPRPQASPLELIRDGWRFVARHPVIRPCVVAATLLNFVAGALMALTPVFLVRTLGAEPGLVGVLIATGGVGSLLGASITPRLARRLGSARAVVAGGVLAAGLLALVPLATAGPGLVLFGLGNGGFSLGVVVVSVLTRTHRQTVTPRELLPRVMATVRFVSWGAIPFGALTAGVVSSQLGVRTALWVAVVVVAVVPAALSASGLWARRELTDGGLAAGGRSDGAAHQG
jgi:MFS family permease